MAPPTAQESVNETGTTRARSRPGSAAPWEVLTTCLSGRPLWASRILTCCLQCRAWGLRSSVVAAAPTVLSVRPVMVWTLPRRGPGGNRRAAVLGGERARGADQCGPGRCAPRLTPAAALATRRAAALLAGPGLGETTELDHQPVSAVPPGHFPINRSISPGHGAPALPGRRETEFAAYAFDQVFGLVAAEVVTAPHLDRFPGHLTPGVCVVILTATTSRAGGHFSP